MDVSITFSQIYKQTLTGSRSRSGSSDGGGVVSMTEYTCPADCYALVYMTSLVIPAPGVGTVSFGLSNASVSSLSLSESVTGSGSYSNSKVLGSIFIGPGQVMYSNYNSNVGGASSSSVSWVIVEFKSVT